MKIHTSRKRSGPIYRRTGGGVVSYVAERANISVSLGKLRLELPPNRRVFVIDESGVHSRKEQQAERLVIPLLALLLALLALERLAKRRTSR
jgi:hypothetical protein